LLDGAWKGVRMNWLASEVRASIYYDAIMRHAMRYFEGEYLDPDSGKPHLAHLIASAAILIDAHESETLIDDRNYEGNFEDMIKEINDAVAELKAKYADKSPHHYTIKDNSKKDI
jgi:hypothetical protein